MKLDESVINYRQALCTQYMARANGILHLGANLGTEADSYAELGKPALWIEAIPEIRAQLDEKLGGFPDQASLCALVGDKDDAPTTFHISGNSDGVSSSIYEFGPFAGGVKTLWPELELKMVDHLTLPMVRLDTLLQRSGIDPSMFDYWVVDLQGAEKLALQGGANALTTCKALLVEVSTVEVYRNGVLWPALSAWLDEQGFMPLWEPVMEHDDVLFIRKSDKHNLVDTFHSDNYMRHNQRRLEHLASQGLDLFNKRVLEVGAGIGDHTSFYLDRECEVLTSDARPENVLALRERFSGFKQVQVATIDMNQPTALDRNFEIVHCYGLLYHLAKPDQALEFLCKHCDALLLLETCVSYGNEVRLNLVQEPAHQFSQAFNGMGCRPTRSWVMQHLSRFMPHVYVTRTQPAHPEFPLDWTKTENDLGQLKRTVFIASRAPLDDNPQLVKGLPLHQVRL
jgi:FkbM family methyltransferase